MFTGLVSERGRLSADPEPSSRRGVRLRLAHSAALGERLSVGASLAVAGVCLTLVESSPEESVVELSRETLARTRLGSLRRGAEVNLEPALRAGDALGGHFVQGHVDGLVRVVRRADLGDHARLTFQLSAASSPWIVEKGSVAIDGVSLTVASRSAHEFDVALIPHTLAVTTLGGARAGDALHFEADVLAKYVAQAVAAQAPRS